MEDNFIIGECSICFKYAPLKNNICLECQTKLDYKEMPQIIKDLFSNFN